MPALNLSIALIEPITYIELSRYPVQKFIISSLLFVSAAANAVDYDIAVLESLSGSGDSLAHALNDNGMVVGQSYNTSTTQLESVIWNNGVIQSLGVSGIARGVNNSGIVVGETGSGSLVTPDGYAYSWNSTDGITNLGTLGGTYSGAFDINESGVITGHSWIPGEGVLASHGFVYKDGVMSDLGTISEPLGYARGEGINDAGEIVGRASVSLFGNSDKFLTYWEADGTLNQYIGPGTYSTGVQINNNGLIVGSARTATGGNTIFASAWDLDGNITFLDDFGGDQSKAWSVNDAGVIVGFARDGVGASTNRAFVSYDGVSITDLNTLVNLDGTALTALTEAYDVNESGQIVGIGVTASGQQLAFLLTPVDPADIVAIDVDPWSPANEIRPASNNLIAVAVMGSNTATGDASDFDASQVNPASVKLGVGEAQNQATPLLADLDGDTNIDVAFGFRTQDTGIVCGDTEVTLVGETYAGDPFTGTDTVNTTDCVDTGCHP